MLDDVLIIRIMLWKEMKYKKEFINLSMIL